MNNKDIDDLIDVAAREMVRREPLSALGHSVSARVRNSDGSRGWSWVWVPAGAAAAIAVALVLATWPVEVKIPPVSRLVIPEAGSPVSPAPPEELFETFTPAMPRRFRQVARPSTPNAMSAALPAPERMVVPTIEVAPIAIDPLVVAPLTTSND